MKPTGHRTLVVALVGFSLLVGLGLGEIALYLVEKKIGNSKFKLLKIATYENFYFHNLTPKDVPPKEPPPYFDRSLGWRPFQVEEEKKTNRVSLNAQGFRGSRDFSVGKTKRRVIMVGDSYTWAAGVGEEETPAGHLQKLLGAKYEVWNMGVGAYGIDQIALMATTVAAKYNPDILILAFPDDDLRRSCYRYQYVARKPYFEIKDGKLELKGVPVASPYETFLEHQSLFAKAKDAVLATVSRSRTVGLLAQLYLAPKLERCKAELNSAILKDVREKIPPSTKLIYSLLGGNPPPAFERSLAQLGVPYVRMEDHMTRLSKTYGVTPGVLPDLHPDAAANLLFAHAFKEEIQRIGG